MAKERKQETVEVRREREILQQEISNRQERFKELLGDDCAYIDALVIRTTISPWDVKDLLDKGCPKNLVPEILL